MNDKYDEFIVEENKINPFLAAVLILLIIILSSLAWKEFGPENTGKPGSTYSETVTTDDLAAWQVELAAMLNTAKNEAAQNDSTNDTVADTVAQILAQQLAELEENKANRPGGTENPEDTGENAKEEQNAPNSNTVLVAFNANVKDPKTLKEAHQLLDEFDQGSNVVWVLDIPLGIASVTGVDVYGAESTGPSMQDLAPTNNGIGSLVTSMFLPDKPIASLQATEVVAGTGMIQSMYHLGETAGSIQSTWFFIPPEYEGNERFYTQEAAAEWARENVNRNVGGVLMGQVGIEITMTIDVCLHTSLDTQNIAGDSIPPSARGIFQRAVRIWEAVENSAEEGYYNNLGAHNEAERKAVEALKNSQEAQEAGWLAAEYALSPEGSTFQSFATTFLNLGFSEVELTINMSRNGACSYFDNFNN